MRLIVEVDGECQIYAYRENETRFKKNEIKRAAKFKKGTVEMLANQCDLHNPGYRRVYWTFRI